MVGAGIASIMVYVDLDHSCEARINIAADLAARYGAALIGVAGWLPGRERGGWFAAELERPGDRLDRISTELEKLAERFRDVAHRTVRVVEWRGRPHFPREVIAAEARAADLVVVGSHTVAEDVYHAF